MKSGTYSIVIAPLRPPRSQIACRPESLLHGCELPAKLGGSLDTGC